MKSIDVTRGINAEPGICAPGSGSASVTPSNSTDLAQVARSLYVTVAGDVTFTGLDGVDSVWTVPANFIIPVAMTRVKSTGTTATGLIAIW